MAFLPGVLGCLALRRIPRSAGWYAHLHGLATAIHETSGLREIIRWAELSYHVSHISYLRSKIQDLRSFRGHSLARREFIEYQARAPLAPSPTRPMLVESSPAISLLVLHGKWYLRQPAKCTSAPWILLGRVDPAPIRHNLRRGEISPPTCHL
jgi:hypothetical protein